MRSAAFRPPLDGSASAPHREHPTPAHRRGSISFRRSHRAARPGRRDSRLLSATAITAQRFSAVEGSSCASARGCRQTSPRGRPTGGQHAQDGGARLQSAQALRCRQRQRLAGEQQREERRRDEALRPHATARAASAASPARAACGSPASARPARRRAADKPLRWSISLALPRARSCAVEKAAWASPASFSIARWHSSSARRLAVGARHRHHFLHHLAHHGADLPLNAVITAVELLRDRRDNVVGGWHQLAPQLAHHVGRNQRRHLRRTDRPPRAGACSAASFEPMTRSPRP